MSSDLIKGLCHCMEVLVGDNKQDVFLESSQTETDAFLAHLKKNIGLVSLEIKAHPKLQGLLDIYEKNLVLENEVFIHLNFTTWCLVLITELNNLLTSAGNQEGIVKSPLSISQQKTVEKCLQFVIALGFLPNLIPGLGISLHRRVGCAPVVEDIGRDVCPRTKYKYLVTCAAVLLKCISHIELQSIILTRHAGDLLAALFQLCHAPIRKMKSPMVTNELHHVKSYLSADKESVKRPLSFGKDLVALLEEIEGSKQWTDEELVCEMHKDRHLFLPHFRNLLVQICPEVLIWELFLPQGMSYNSNESCQAKAPLWLRKLCNDMLTQQLFEPQGLKLFIHIMLDKMTDSDMNEGAIDKRKIEAVANLISRYPYQNMTLEEYIKALSAQIINLLHSNKSQMDAIFSCVASSVILQFAGINLSLCEKYILRNLFREFWICLDKLEIAHCAEGASLIPEESLTACIENAFQMFVNNCISPEHCDAFNLLLPFYHLLFTLFAEMNNGVSFLCSKLQSLLVSLIKSFSAEEAVMLLCLASFEDVAFHSVVYVTGIKCNFGDSGGIVVTKNSLQNPEDLLDDANKKSLAVINIIDQISNKKLKVSYFLYLLKRLTQTSMNDFTTDEESLTRYLKCNLVLLQQFQIIADTIGEELVEDIVEAVQFVKVIIEKANDNENNPLSQLRHLLVGSEVVVTSLVILSTIIEYKAQLSSEHWRILKDCVPSLQKLQTNSNDSIIRTMCENLIIPIATHGAATNSNETKESLSSHTSKFENAHLSDKNDKTSAVSQISYHSAPEQRDKENKDIKSSADKSCMVDVTPKENICNSNSIKLLQEKKEACSPPLIENDADLPPGGNSAQNSSSRDLVSSYQSAIRDINDPILPVRGHGLITLSKLISQRNDEAMAKKESVLRIFVENLSDGDSYIYLASIQGLSALADVSTELVFPTILEKFCNIEEDNYEMQLKLGEVLMKICKNLGEMTVKYKREFIHAYLCGAKNKRPEIRASSLSNLGEVCKCLKFSLDPFLQEILVCVLSLLKTDEDMEVRRSAALVVYLLLQGAGKHAFVVLEKELKDLYHVLKHTYNCAKDDVLKLHAQLALEEINLIIKEVFCSRSTLTKEIRVLDPF